MLIIEYEEEIKGYEQSLQKNNAIDCNSNVMQ